MKNLLKLLIFNCLFLTISVNAASYDMVLEGTTNVEKNSTVDAYIAIKNISGFDEGVIACTASLSSSSNIKINSVSQLNGWTVLYGGGISADIYPGVKTYSRLAKVNLTVIGEGTLTLSNVFCSDGVVEPYYPGNTLRYTIKTTTTTTTSKTATTTTTTTKKTTTKPSTTINSNNSSTTTTTTEKQEKPYLNGLSIENYDLNFQKDKYEYEISVTNEVDKLNIVYNTINSDIVEIKGNENFKVGLNKVKIVLTAKNGWQTTYSIKVIKEALNEYIENNEETIIHAIKQNDNIKVKVDINDNNKLISTNILNELKINRKNITYTIFNKNNRVYSFQVFGTGIINTNPISFGIKFESDYGNNINNILKSKKHKIINFDYSGDLPLDTEIIIYNMDMSDNGYFYYYNPNNNELEYHSDVKLIDNNLVLKLEHCSEYVYLEEKIDTSLKVLFVGGSILYGISVVLILGLYIILAIKRKEHK